MGYIEPTSLRSHADTNALSKVHYEGQPDSERRLDELATTVFKELADTEGKLEGLFQGTAKKLVSGRATCGVGNLVDVAFTNPLPTAEYAILLTSDFMSGPTGTKPYYTAKTVTGFRIHCDDTFIVNWIVLYGE